jgi:hypothetical protein
MRPILSSNSPIPSGFAASGSATEMIGSDPNHFVITSSDIFFNPNFNWHFNTTLAVPEPSTAALLTAIAGLTLTSRRKRRMY